MLNRILALIDKITRVLCGAMVAAILVINFAAVLMRYLFSKPLFWCEEVSLLLFAWCIACALIPLTYKRGGVALDFFVDLLPERGKKILEVIVNILGAALLLTVSWFGVQLMQRSMYRFTPILRIPYRYIYLSMVIGMTVSAVILIVFAIEDSLRLFKPEREVSKEC